jgi:hypothetical protein
LAARSLARKRAETVARVCATLPGALGYDAFHQAFAAYAAETPLADELRLRAFLIDLTSARSPCGLRPRRGVAVRFAWLRQSRRLLLGCGLPWLGVKWFSARVRGLPSGVR